MAQSARKTIRFRGREEPVIDTFRVRGRSYFAVERLSGRGAFRAFDPSAGTNGEYRAVYRFPAAKLNSQRLEVLRRISGANANRNFPGLVECNRQGDEYFVVFEWLSGNNVRDYLRAIREGKAARPSVSEVVRLLRGLAHGLGHYHRKSNIVHGDISTANIVLSSGTTHLVLVDFGSAWPVEDSGRKSSGDGITKTYAAPERFAKHQLEDFRADVFSLSVVAYEMLTLEIPFDGIGGQAGLPNVIAGAKTTYKPPSTMLQHKNRLPKSAVAELDQCVGRGLQLSADDRYSTRGEWLDAWDQLHLSFQKQSKLNRIEAVMLGAIEQCGRLLGLTRDGEY